MQERGNLDFQTRKNGFSEEAGKGRTRGKGGQEGRGGKKGSEKGRCEGIGRFVRFTLIVRHEEGEGGEKAGGKGRREGSGFCRVSRWGCATVVAGHKISRVMAQPFVLFV